MSETPLEQQIKELQERIARLERIVKSGFDFDKPEISEEVKEL